mmetsp:Transcript_23588/g.67441  ORF Transcript_23588/g.67441 Transcript_23588/m.67441 type:complete len:465 (-) Transcript_23588:86-1480(-)
MTWTAWLARAFPLVWFVALGEVPNDEVKALPGWDGPLPSRQFSGYLKVGSRHMHYWLVEREAHPETAPTLLWLNGGPGCSSLEGLMYETGPFGVSPSDPMKLTLRQFAWSKLANVIYLETPAGVGYSYSDDPADYTTDDDATAKANVETMNAFFAAWPEWRGNDFFIVGFSYGGMYVPTLAEGILWADGNGTWKGGKLKGIAVGNGVTGSDYVHDLRYKIEFFLRTPFLNSTLRSSIRRACDLSTASMTPECERLVKVMFSTIGHVNGYNVYHSCIDGNDECPCFDEDRLRAPLEASMGGHSSCGDESLRTDGYLNDPSVLAAAHMVKQPYAWSACKGNQISYTETRRNLPRDTYPFLIRNIKVTIYNGDSDVSIPYTGDEAWTQAMGYAVKAPWHAWTYGGDQVAGYATVYEHDFAFVTVKGAGHLMPEDAPEQGFELIRRVLSLEGFGAPRAAGRAADVVYA